MKPRVSLIVTDLDNTLYDWVRAWYQAFGGLLDVLIAGSGVPREKLEAEAQAVFQKHGSSEYAFMVQELPSLIRRHSGEDPACVYQDAIAACRETWRSSLQLYPGVLRALQALKECGCLLVGFTEALEVYITARIKRLNLDGLLDYVYSLPGHALPSGQSRIYDQGETSLQATLHRTVPVGEQKPNPKVLLDILADDGIHGDLRQSAYVGDSLFKDIQMAQAAGVWDVFARYGAAQQTEAYELLRRVTHWSEAEVESEKSIIQSGTIIPTYVLERSFDQLLEIFDFVPHIMH